MGEILVEERLFFVTLDACFGRHCLDSIMDALGFGVSLGAAYSVSSRCCLLDVVALDDR